MKSIKKKSNLKVKKEPFLFEKSHTFSGLKQPDNLYYDSKRIRSEQMLFSRNRGYESRLGAIVTEINLRNMIVQQEIYFIGELLSEAKQILIENRKSFKVWIEENFDFGYHTAINFCNVYIACIGQLELIVNVKPSVLYRISSKKFSKELKDFLIFNNLLDHLRIKELEILYREYKEKGFDFVKSKLEEKSKIPLSKQFIIPYIDNFSKTIYFLKNQHSILIKKLYRNEDIDKRKGSTEDGDKVFNDISSAYEKCLELLIIAKYKVDLEIRRLDFNVYNGFDERRSLYVYNQFNVLDKDSEEINNQAKSHYGHRVNIIIDFGDERVHCSSMTAFKAKKMKQPEVNEPSNRLQVSDSSDEDDPVIDA